MAGVFSDPSVWVLFSFVIFVAMFWRFGGKKILSFLDGRIEKIRKEIADAEALRNEAQSLLAEYQRKQRDAAQEAEAIIATARHQAAQILKAAESDLDETMKRKEVQLAERLHRMEEHAMQEIRSYAAELAVRATSEVIAKKMDEKTNARLVDESIKAVAGQLA